MKLLSINKVKDGKYLKNYELLYENKAGHEKCFEIVSHHEIEDASQLGNRVSGVSIVAFSQGKMLFLREFRMGANRFIYNFCAGMKKKDETIEACIRRELYEETGLSVKKIHTILNPSFAAIALSDIMNQIAVVEVEGTFSEEHMSENELIHAAFYTKEEVKELLEKEQFSSRAQLAAWVFTIGGFEKILDTI